MSIKTFTYPAVTITSGAVSFNLDGVLTEVSKDTVTPANSRALPVELMGTAGPINITAGDLNVQLTDTGANPDKTRIGDGTNQLAITASSEAKTSDATAQASLASIDTKLTSPLAVTGPLTDTELRATAVPVSGPLTDTELRATAVSVLGPLTDTELRASAVPVSAAALPLPTGASTETTLAALNAKVTAVDTGAVTVVSAPGLTDTELRASAVPVSLASTTITGSVAVTGPLTDTQLRASAVPVSLASTTITGSVAVTGALTDTELRATPVDVTVIGSVTAPNPSVAALGVTAPAYATMIGGYDNANFFQSFKVSATGAQLVDGSATTQPVSIAASVAVTGALTDTELRATAVPVSGPLTDTELRATAVPVSLASTTITGSVAVTGPLTDTELRATPVDVAVIGSVTATNPSVSEFSLTNPSFGTAIGGYDGTNAFRPLKVNGADALTVDGSAVTQPVSIASSIAVTGPLTDTELRATAVPVSGTVSANQSGSWNIGNITGTVVLPTGASTETTLAALNAKVTAVDTGAVVVTSTVGLTDTQLRASAVPVSMTSTTITGSVATVAAGRSKVALLRNDYATTPVTTAAYVQLTGG